MKAVLALAFAVIISGCSTYAVPRYSINADTVTALRTLNGHAINVGSFGGAEGMKKEIMCRGVGPIKTPDGEAFSDFVRKALVDELQIANAFSSTAPVTLTGSLDKIDFSSMSGGWDIELNIKSSNGKSMKVAENYKFTTSYMGETACNQTAQALMPAVQNLVAKLVQNPAFAGLTK